MSVLDDFVRLLKTLPPDPIAPENRRVTRLFPSGWVQRGSVFRLVPQPDIVGHNFPLIVMNVDDVRMLRVEFATLPLVVDVDQEIADCCEQLFAEREAREGR